MKYILSLFVLVLGNLAQALNCNSYLKHIERHGIHIVSGDASESSNFKYFRFQNSTKKLAVLKSYSVEFDKIKNQFNISESLTPMNFQISMANDNCDNVGLYIRDEKDPLVKHFDFDWKACKSLLTVVARFYNIDGSEKIEWDPALLNSTEKKEYERICDELTSSGYVRAFGKGNVCPSAVSLCASSHQKFDKDEKDSQYEKGASKLERMKSDNVR